jgi:hypothetical protein
MQTNVRNIAAPILLAATTAAATAGPSEVASSAASAASSVVTKVEGAVVRTAQKAASAVEYGASVAGHAVSDTAKKLGLPAQAASAASAPK